MPNRLNFLSTLTDSVSRRFYRWLVVLVATVVIVSIMAFLIEPKIIKETGHRVFDAQTGLTAAQVAEQLPAYTSKARTLVWAFYVGDTFFPFLAALLSAALAAWGMRRAWPQAYESGRLPRWLPLLYLGAALDWAENVVNLYAINTYPPLVDSKVHGVIIVKNLKGEIGAIVGAIAIGLFLCGLIASAMRLARRSSVPI